MATDMQPEEMETAQPANPDTLTRMAHATGPRQLAHHPAVNIVDSPCTTKRMIRYTESELRKIQTERENEMTIYNEAEALDVRKRTTVEIPPAAPKEVTSKRGKLKGTRPDRLRCDRLAFWELDFCAPCLTAEVKLWNVKSTEGNRPAERNNRTAMTSSQSPPLSAAEVRALQSFPSDTRHFCVGNRVSMTIMNSMLARDGRQSHNPFIRQYAPRSERSGNGSNDSTEHDGRDVSHGERSDTLTSIWSEVSYHDRDSHMDSMDENSYGTQSQIHGGRHFGRLLPPEATTPRSLPFRDYERSPLRSIIGPQRKPALTAGPGINDDGRRELFPNKPHSRQTPSEASGTKRKGIQEHGGSRDDRDGWDSDNPRSSTKKMKIETDDDMMDGEKPSVTENDTRINMESHQTPTEGWVSEVLENILQMEMVARPATPREVGLAIKKELEVRLIEDVMYGDPYEGRPISIPLLRALNEALDSEENGASA